MLAFQHDLLLVLAARKVPLKHTEHAKHSNSMFPEQCRALARAPLLLPPFLLLLTLSWPRQQHLEGKWLTPRYAWAGPALKAQTSASTVWCDLPHFMTCTVSSRPS